MIGSLKNNSFTLTALIVLGLIFFAPVLWLGKSVVDMTALVDKTPWREELNLNLVKPGHSQTDGATNYFPMLSGCVLPVLKNWQIPTWCPNLIGGYPILANSDIRVLTWSNLFYLITSPERAFSYSVISHFLLLAIFSYFYFREVKLSKVGSWLGTVVLIFSNWIMSYFAESWLLPSFVWLPLILLIIEKLKREFKPLLVIILIIISSLVWYASHPQIAIYVSCFSLVYFIFRLKNNFNCLKTIGLILLVYAGSLFLSAWQILPLYELQSFSQRQASQELSWVSPFRLMVSIWPEASGQNKEEIAEVNQIETTFWARLGVTQQNLADGIYIGIMPLIFSLLVLGFKKKPALVKFFSASVLVITVIQLLMIIVQPLAIKIPVINRLERSARINLLIIFSLSYLAGLGLDRFIARAGVFKKRIKIITIALLSFLALILTFTVIFSLPDWKNLFERSFPAGSFWESAFKSWPNLIKHFNPFNPNLITYSVILIISLIICQLYLRLKITAKYFKFLVLTVTSGASLFYGWQINPWRTPISSVYPEIKIVKFLKEREGNNYYRVASLNAPKVMYNNTFLAYDIADIGVEITLYPKWYSEYFSYAQRESLEQLFDNHLWLSNPNSPLLDIFNVKYIVTSSEKNSPAGKFKLVYRDKQTKIFENQMVFPKAWLVNSLETIKNSEGILARLNSGNFNAKTTAIIEEEVGYKATADSKAWVQIIDYGSANIILETKTTGNAFLVLADTWYPSWQAKIDGRQTKVYKTNYISRGVFVPSGQHKIELYFDSQTTKNGFAISFISGLILLSLFCFFSLKRLRLNKNKILN